MSALSENSDATANEVARPRATNARENATTEQPSPSNFTIVKLSPDRHIHFNESAINPRESKLTIQNTSEHIVAFKLKTTSPKAYLVKPSTGAIHPGELTNIKIVYQANWCVDDHHPNVTPPGATFTNKDRCSDKFLIQVAKVQKNALDNVRDIWKHIRKENIEEARLGVYISGDSENGEGPKHDIKNEDPTSKHTTQPVYAPSPQFLSQMKELQRENFKLSQEVEHLKQTILSIQSVEESSKGILSFSRFDLWHIPLLLLAVLVAWYYLTARPAQDI